MYFINLLKIQICFQKVKHDGMNNSGSFLTLGHCPPHSVCISQRPPLESSVVLTGTWLDRGKPVPGLFFLLLLLLFVPPPPLMVLPPDILRFRRLFGACLDGSAERADRAGKLNDAGRSSWKVSSVYCVCVFAYLAAPPSSAISGTGRS